MGHSASAMIIFGFKIDYEEHEETAQRILGDDYDGDYDSMDWPTHLLNHLQNTIALSKDVKVFMEGYSDEPDYFIGVQLAWAFDYTAKVIDLKKLDVNHYDREALTLLGKNFGLKPEIWLSPSYG